MRVCRRGLGQHHPHSRCSRRPGSCGRPLALPHSEAGHVVPAGLPVAIETARGLVVDRILAAGHPAVAAHPDVFNAVRPRWSAARAKDDPGDAFKHAGYLRTDGRRQRALRPTEQVTLELQALVRAREDQVTARVTATNQLAALLAEHWSGARMIFARLGSDIDLAFCDRFPTPTSARRPAPARLRDRLPVSTTPDATIRPCWRPGCATIPRLPPGSARRRSLRWSVLRSRSSGPEDRGLRARGSDRIGSGRSRDSGKSRAIVFRYAANRRARQPSSAGPTTPATPRPGPESSTIPAVNWEKTTPRRADPRPLLTADHLRLLARRNLLRPCHPREAQNRENRALHRPHGLEVGPGDSCRLVPSTDGVARSRDGEIGEQLLPARDAAAAAASAGHR